MSTRPFFGHGFTGLLDGMLRQADCPPTKKVKVTNGIHIPTYPVMPGTLLILGRLLVKSQFRLKYKVSEAKILKAISQRLPVPFS